MTEIRKKILKEHLDNILSGKKRLELRLADFEVKEGDVLLLEEWDPERGEYTGRSAEVSADYILKTSGLDFWPKEKIDEHGYQIIQFSLNRANGAAPDQSFYVGQKAFIEKDGKVLILDHQDGLDFPGGKIQAGETDLVSALKREVREETGMEIEAGEPFATWTVVGRKNNRLIFLVAYKCKWVSGDLKLSDEHLGFKWVDRSTYRELSQTDDYFPILEKYFVDKVR